jgi:arylsulfatase A
LPTFCALSGATPPQDRMLDGYDLSPVLLGKTDKSPRDTVYYLREEKLFAVRQGPWKAHFITEGCYGIGPKREVHEVPELYQVEEDPSEKYNVAEYHPDIVARLKAVAERHIGTIKPVPNQLDVRTPAAK